MIKVILLTLLVSIIASGCGSTGTQPVSVVTQEAPRTQLDLPDPEPLSMPTLRWIVVTPENIEQIWSDLENRENELVLFALTGQGYQTLSIAVSDLRNYISTQRQIIIEYKKYYEDGP